MKLEDIHIGQRVLYCYPDPDTPPRAGTVTVAVHPHGMVTVDLDDGPTATVRPDLLKPHGPAR